MPHMKRSPLDKDDRMHRTAYLADLHSMMSLERKEGNNRSDADCGEEMPFGEKMSTLNL